MRNRSLNFFNEKCIKRNIVHICRKHVNYSHVAPQIYKLNKTKKLRIFTLLTVQTPYDMKKEHYGISNIRRD